MAGCLVEKGYAIKGNPIEIYRDGHLIYSGLLESLRIAKKSTDIVREGLNCGIAIKDYNDIKIGDIIHCLEKKNAHETFKKDYKKHKLILGKTICHTSEVIEENENGKSSCSVTLLLEPGDKGSGLEFINSIKDSKHPHYVMIKNNYLEPIRKSIRNISEKGLLILTSEDNNRLSIIPDLKVQLIDVTLHASFRNIKNDIYKHLLSKYNNLTPHIPIEKNERAMKKIIAASEEAAITLAKHLSFDVNIPRIIECNNTTLDLKARLYRSIFIQKQVDFVKKATEACLKEAIEKANKSLLTPMYNLYINTSSDKAKSLMDELSQNKNVRIEKGTIPGKTSEIIKSTLPVDCFNELNITPHMARVVFSHYLDLENPELTPKRNIRRQEKNILLVTNNHDCDNLEKIENLLSKKFSVDKQSYRDVMSSQFSIKN
jgi:hypothetical protein